MAARWTPIFRHQETCSFEKVSADFISFFPRPAIYKDLRDDPGDAGDIPEEEEHGDQHYNEGPDCYGERLQRNPRDGAAHEETDSQETGDHPDDPVEDESHMEG